MRLFKDMQTFLELAQNLEELTMKTTQTLSWDVTEHLQTQEDTADIASVWYIENGHNAIK
jgi:hypothetical protein